jgi:hypothetical protein
MTGSPTDGLKWWQKAIFYPLYGVVTLVEKISRKDK